jgi:hypothetical protein
MVNPTRLVVLGVATAAVVFVLTGPASGLIGMPSTTRDAAHVLLPSQGSKNSKPVKHHSVGMTSPTARPTPTPSPTPPPVAGLKPAPSGLLYLQGKPPASVRPLLAGYDVQGRGDYGGVSWSELQATPGGPITPNNPIDQAITDVRAWNAANPTHQESLLVRIEAGIHSPAWAMNLGGPCVKVTDPNFGTTGCTPRFWTAQFGTAFYQFESELAAKYDSVPEIGEVIIARDMTVYNEPLLRQIQSPASVAGLLAAGYTTALDEQNQMADIAALGTYWKHTHVGFTFNPYQTVNPIGQDEAFTVQLMSYGRRILGSQLVLENDSLRASFLHSGEYAAMYASMRQLGSPIGFQTAVLSKVGNLMETVQGAAALGANNVELPPGFAPQTASALAPVLADTS